MKRNMSFVGISLVITVFTTVNVPQCVSAEQIKTVLTKVSSIGSQKENTSARPVNAPGVEAIVIGTGTRFDVTKNGQFQSAGPVSQLALVLPAKNSDLSTLQSLCIDRLKALQAGTNGRQALEFTFEGTRIGAGSYLATRLTGCADITSTASIIKPKPAVTPSATPTPVATK